jgi:hypothetical protein
MTDHPTPLPWKFVPWHVEEGPSAVRAPDGHLICSAASDANAALIVKAVNEYTDAEKALLELCGNHGFATGHGDTLADIIREIDGQISERKERA